MRNEKEGGVRKDNKWEKRNAKMRITKGEMRSDRREIMFLSIVYVYVKKNKAKD